MSASQKHKTKAVKPVSERYTLTNAIANLYLTVMFTLFPVFVNFTFDFSFPFLHFDNGYYSIRHQKYFFFLVLTASALIAEMMLLATRTTEAQHENNPKRKKLYTQLSFTDWAVLAFVLTCAVSTLFSPYIDLAFSGETVDNGYAHGRDNGLLLMLVYAAVYFFLTRCWKYKEYVFVALAIGSAAVSLVAVLNGFYMDPLNMFAPFVDDENIFNNFITTIGNKNMFSSHLCVTLPVTVCMFVTTDKLWRRAVYLGAAMLGAMAAVVCDSDSVVLGMSAFTAVFLVIYVRRLVTLKRFLLALTAMLFSIKLLRWLSALGGDHYKELGAIPYHLMLSNTVYVLLAVLAALTAAAYLADAKFPGKTLPKAVPVVLGAVFGAVVLAGLGVVIYFSAINTEADLGDLERTLRFSDAWGTHRGFMWNKAMEAFGGYSPLRKLIGTGPETFYYTFMPYFGELYDRFGDGSTDAAHNEYINYLLNIGILGLLSYLAFTGGALVRALKAVKQNPLAAVFAAPVVAYLAQAVVNISLPIATPLFIIFVSLCEATARQTAKQNAPS